MSVWDLKVTIFIYMSIGVCVIAFPRLLQDKLSILVVGFWVLIVPFLTIIKIPVVTLLVMAGLLLVIGRKLLPTQILFVFVALVAAVPVWFSFKLSFGGFNIYTFGHWAILVFCLLMPMIPYILSIKAKFDLVDILYVIFILFILVYIFAFSGSTSLTSIMRQAINVIFIPLVVYFSFSKITSHQPRQSLMYISYGFMILGLIIAGIFFFNQVIQADLVNVHSTAGNVYNLGYLREYRGGFLRTEGPLAGEAVGLLLAASFWAMYFLRSYFSIGSYRLFAIISFFLIVCVTTGSRGVMLSFLLVGAFFVFMGGSLQLKLLMLVCGVILYLLFFVGGSGIEDEHGTFDFRAQLFETSFRFISEHPFGSPTYGEHHYFDHLRRGPTRFLDVVSVYLQYLLPYGYLGLVLFVLPYLVTIVQLVKMSVVLPSEAGMYADMMRLYAALLVGYLFMISTVSNVGLIEMLGLLFLAISRGIIKGAEQAQPV